MGFVAEVVRLQRVRLKSHDFSYETRFHWSEDLFSFVAEVVRLQRVRLKSHDFSYETRFHWSEDLFSPCEGFAYGPP